MNKKAFTLLELLAVIAIISILSVIVVPNILKVRKNINVRLANEKKQHIISAAELYGTNNPDIFGGTDIVFVQVQDLIDAEYLEIDTKNGESGCDKPSGCIYNPSYSGEPLMENNIDTYRVFNDARIMLTKKNVGVVGSFVNSSISSSTSDTLIAKVCSGFNGSYKGKNLSGVECHCQYNGTEVIDIVDLEGNPVNECILVSISEDGSIDNWLKYGSSQANWRVIGLYRVNNNISAKMITSNLIEE